MFKVCVTFETSPIHKVLQGSPEANQNLQRRSERIIYNELFQEYGFQLRPRH